MLERGAMKPAPFEYVVARSAGDVVAALADGRARVLAGGQSLVLEMNYRIARPERLVDINRVPAFASLDVDGDAVRVGPLVRHRVFETDAVPGPLGVLLRRVVRNIAHPPIRARGTMLGSCAYAHPAAEWPAVAVTLGARFDLLSAAGIRTVAAADFFTGPFTTVRRPEELLLAVHLPKMPPGTLVGFVEHRRTHASFAGLAAMVAVTVTGGRVRAAHVGLVNAADRPVRAGTAEEVLTDRPLDDATVADAAAAAADLDADAYQRHAVGVLVRRALHQARDGG
ncbi:FAD binding domain-containing protein [Dactylosporangium sp. CS-033363]|uniref:FAD binding domain-containing protein n=1 Tax=Dactylosporangium sp. CS-033363 TaxID=3239935 RepID=UPI003D939837